MIKIAKNLLFLMAGACLLLAGCASPGAKPADIELPVQDAAVYLKKSWQIEPDVQQAFTSVMLAQYFQCWSEPEPQVGLDAMIEALEKGEAEPGLAENLLPRTPFWYRDLAALADLDAYPNQAWQGLTLGWANLRVLPTAKPALYSADRAGAMMFDSLQQSLLPPNMPVYVHHQSRDGAWLMVQTPIAWGWLPVRGVARLSEAQAHRWQAGPFMVFVQDDVPVKEGGGGYLFKARIGCILPLADGPSNLLCAVSDGHGGALLETAPVPGEAATALPLALNSENLAAIINRMLGTPYGWGGLYINRDCSATLQDLFRVFGLGLPRNSSDQMESGRIIVLEGRDDDAKQALILRRGLPGLSLLHLPGHIMLYLGRDGREPVIFHNVWGLRVENLLGEEGRAMLGRAVITTLKPGKELVWLTRPEGYLVNRIDAMTLLFNEGDMEALIPVKSVE